MDRPRLLTRRHALGLGAAAAASLSLPGCSRGRSDEPAPAGPAKFATGNEGGVYAIYGAGLAKLVSEVTGVAMTPILTEGSVANLRMLSAGTADIGFSLSDSALDAWEGTPGTQFATGSLRSRFTALARTYDNYVHVVVPTGSDVTRFEDLNGKVVSIGPQNSGTRVVAQRILNTAGVKVIPRFFDLETAVQALQDKVRNPRAGIDALIWSGGLPTKPILGLQSTTGFRLVDIGSTAQAIASKRFGGYVLSSIPPSVYQLSASVPTLAVPNYLLARRGLSDSWAWWTLNTMFRRQTDLMAVHPEAGSLDARSAIATMPIPLHPAAERWYKNNHI
ncbi:TRAP transporter solute receptor, TAXI family [Kribbella flavida DSM 17836]|uniref:TRAP transporter solute receptor, TAXI family n=1 Tax=Kribbella flavida (strain DSM 17836 / JCM 10339 / NBRC 14399) TaxID=479435 RepID=D2Q036_KRIFD|nr:TAXI family TRAP transporter solute-binding subunit [Kribbella flavida]ADB30034.1 TRAP transporter solute receptor, TAXI family [Kribbella flavida DSM 17836]